MKIKALRKATALLIALSMLICAVTPLGASAAEMTDLGLSWPAGNWRDGTPPEWARNLDKAGQDATVAAFNTEYQRQLDSGYILGRDNLYIAAWGNCVSIQCQGADSSNPGNPWGQEGRKWAMMIAPFPGMAFSVKGYFSQHISPDQPVLSNELEWTDPSSGVTKLYQTFQNSTFTFNTNGTGKTTVNAVVGQYLDPNDIDKFQYAYSASAWLNESFGRPYNLGHCVGNTPVTEGDVVYQEFFGNESSGASPETDRGLDKAFGISYIAMEHLGDAAYIITDEIFNAWREKYWVRQEDGSYNKFGITGAPTSNQFTDGDLLCQDFENGMLCYNTETGEISELISNDASIHDAGIPYIATVSEGSNIYYLVENNVDITSLAPEFTINESSVITPAADVKQDFTESVKYTVVAESGRTATYSVTFFTESHITDADRKAVEALREAFDKLPVVMYRNMLDQAQAIFDQYSSLTPLQKMLTGEVEALEALQKRIDIISSYPIKVSCVGDSITQGIGATNQGRYSYPAQMQEILGDGYDILNVGVSGTVALDDRGYRYRSTDQYVIGKEFMPDIVTIALGTNDATTGMWNADQFRKDYTSLVLEYINLPSKPTVILSVPMSTFDIDEARRNNNINGTIPIINEIAEKYDLEVIDMYSYTADHSDWFGDGLHPNDYGYSQVAPEFARYVEAAAAPMCDYSVDKVMLNYIQFKDFNAQTYNYTVKVDSLSDLPQVSVTLPRRALQTAKVTQATKQNPTATILIESQRGMYGVAYTITFEASIPGDLDTNGKVTVSDILALKTIIMSGKTPTEAQLKVADLAPATPDGKLTVSDILGIKAIIMG